MTTTMVEMKRVVDLAREEGLEVVRAVVLVDRQEGGLENIRGCVPDTTAIVTRDDLLRHIEAGA